MTEHKSLLDELCTDSGAFDKERTVRILKAVLSIQREEHLICLNKEGNALKNEEKILAYVLAKKLLKSEGAIEDNGVSGKEVHEKTGLPKGTVAPTMQKLKKDGLLAGSGSNYEIPTHRVEIVLEQLEKSIAKNK